jgi:cytosine/adenosine deaminase-related metal-dependent hydrolase
MRYLNADRIFDGFQMHQQSCLVMKDEIVVKIILLDQLPDSTLVERFEGVLCPGFINTHCHLELSHLLHKIPRKTGLPGFISKIQQVRNTEPDLIKEAVLIAAQKMKASGVVGLGDIANGLDSLKVKELRLFKSHTFVEVFGFNPDLANAAFARAMLVKQGFKEEGNSLVPHAPYSVSKELFGLIFQENKKSPLTIHNQECLAETEMFENGNGDLYFQLKEFGLDMDAWELPKKSSLKAVLPFFPKDQNVLLVHNTFSTRADRNWANIEHNRLYWCTCPKANLYIEDSLPNYTEMLADNCRMTIGTDSLASNDALSIWDEIKTIQTAFPELSLQELLTWATRNGAEALNFKKLGVFKAGMAPGVVHLPGGLNFSDNSYLLINFGKS